MNRIRVIVLHTVASLLLVLSGGAHLRAVLMQPIDAGEAGSVHIVSAAADSSCDLLTVRTAAGRRLSEPCERRRERTGSALLAFALMAPQAAASTLPQSRTFMQLHGAAASIPDKFKAFVSFLQSLL